jgi:hypothetical protein
VHNQGNFEVSNNGLELSVAVVKGFGVTELTPGQSHAFGSCTTPTTPVPFRYAIWPTSAMAEYDEDPNPGDQLYLAIRLSEIIPLFSMASTAVLGRQPRRTLTTAPMTLPGPGSF